MTRRRWLVVALAAVVPAAAFAFDRVSSRTEPGVVDVAPAALSTGRYVTDLGLALSPLLTHVTSFPRLLAGVAASTDPPVAATIAAAWSMAEDFATARDLTDRLAQATDSGTAGELATSATMLYREAALLVSDGPPVRTSSQWAAAARSAQRLRVVGDRLFDQVRRLADDDRGLTVLPRPVPDFAIDDLGGASELVSKSDTADRELLPTDAWWAQQGSHLRRMVALESGVEAPLAQEQDAVRQLDDPLPSESSVREAVMAAQLGALVENEAQRLSRGLPAVDDLTARLDLIAERLWEQARRLFSVGGANEASVLSPRRSEADPSVLHRGGVFDGRPPPLRPGDPATAGLPSGIAPPDLAGVVAGNDSWTTKE